MLSTSQIHYKIIGAMSGTSLDGLDLALVQFDKVDDRWLFTIEKAETLEYPDDMVVALKAAIGLTNNQIKALDLRLGEFIGKAVRDFVGNTENINFIASHGHTIFHQPTQGITLQIGDGEVISQVSGLPVINNFRSKDVALGGQGAPLVPIGDRDLFFSFDYCLNLGGIANISYAEQEKRLAFDICPFNIALNELAQQKGLPYDDKGKIASTGVVDLGLLEALNQIPYLSMDAPKSLGLEDYRKLWLPLIASSSLSIEDKMASFVEHAAIQISQCMSGEKHEKVLVTGGGAFHDYFINRLKDLTSTTICIPDHQTVNFKEALVFAYLGLLRHQGQPNCLSSVTGAPHDNSGGDLYNF